MNDGSETTKRAADKPRVQIGLPVYNGSNYLAEAIESFQAQTFADFEILISDNGSTDSTPEIAQKFAAADPRVRFFRYETNRGAAWNFNNVARLADAELFTWAAHDDLRHPQFLSRCIEVLDQNPELICAYPATQSVDAEGTPTGGYYSDRCHLVQRRPSARYRETLGKYPMHVLFGVMRREQLMRTRLWGGFAAADRVLVSEVALHGQIHELPEQLFYRRWHPQVSWIYGMSDREYAAWYDPRNRGRRLTVPKLQRGLEYAKAVHHAHLPPLEAARAYRYFTRYALWDQGILSVARQFGKRMGKRPSPA